MADEKKPHLRPFQPRGRIVPPEPGALASPEHRRLNAQPLPPMSELMAEANDIETARREAERNAEVHAQQAVEDEYEKHQFYYSEAADVSIVDVDWLWKPWLAFGKLTMLDGDPSLGKSTLALTFAACVSNGFRFPMESAPIQAREPANALILSAEDAAGDTIAPRLREAGAEMKRVKIIHATNHNGHHRFVHLPEDVEALHNFIMWHHIRFGVIDVLSAYIGGRGMNTHADADIRTVLSQVSALAENTHASIMALRHLNKTSSEHNAMYRGGGSIAIIGAARTAMVVAKHPRDETKRVLACVKNNLGPLPEMIAYSVVRGDSFDTARIQWHQEPVNVTLAEMMRGPVSEKPGPPPTARDVAADCILSFLKDGERLQVDIVALAEVSEISMATLYRAKKELGVVSRIEVTEDGTRRSWWRLPDHDA